MVRIAVHQDMSGGKIEIAVTHVGGEAAVDHSLSERIVVGAPVDADAGFGAGAKNRNDGRVVPRLIEKRVGGQVDGAEQHVALAGRDRAAEIGIE